MAPRIAGVLAARGSEHALVVHGGDRLDEITITDSTRIYEVRNGEVIGETEFEPESVGIRRVNRSEIQGGSAEDNVRIMHELFAGEEAGPRADIVAINAAAGLVVAGVADSLESGLDKARTAISDGKAAAKLKAVVDLSNEIAG
tara:strand:- start:1378 stop:1809 length:432 start_codon:yes stop_codon:yes gene_type:complete